MSSRCRREYSSSGFTLVEVLVSAVLFGLILGTLYGIAQTALGIGDTLGATRAARTGADAITARLRSDVEAGRVMEASGPFLRVAVDADTVTYSWQGAGNPILLRKVGAHADTLAPAVTFLEFAPRTYTYPAIEEFVTTQSLPATAVRFEPGDWDEIVNNGPCSYLPRGRVEIGGTSWIGCRFSSTETLSSFTSASLRASAVLGSTDGDLVLEIYRASTSTPHDPEHLMYQARINATDLTPTVEWHTAFFNEIDGSPVVAATRMWLVVRPLFAFHAYAGEIELEAINCLVIDPNYPDNGLSTFLTEDQGALWSPLDSTTDMFAVIEATVDATALFETTVSRTDTTGVQVTLSVTEESATEERAIEIAGIDL